jgi:hypothetical protein
VHLTRAENTATSAVVISVSGAGPFTHRAVPVPSSSNQSPAQQATKELAGRASQNPLCLGSWSRPGSWRWQQLGDGGKVRDKV